MKLSYCLDLQRLQQHEKSAKGEKILSKLPWVGKLFRGAPARVVPPPLPSVGGALPPSVPGRLPFSTGANGHEAAIAGQSAAGVAGKEILKKGPMWKDPRFLGGAALGGAGFGTLGVNTSRMVSDAHNDMRYLTDMGRATEVGVGLAARQFADMPWHQRLGAAFAPDKWRADYLRKVSPGAADAYEGPAAQLYNASKQNYATGKGNGAALWKLLGKTPAEIAGAQMYGREGNLGWVARGSLGI